MAFLFQKLKAGLKFALNEVLCNIRTTNHPLLRCTPFEAHFDCKPNTIWHSITRSALFENLNWTNVLFSLNRNQKMFPAKVMQDCAQPDDETNMGIFDRIDYPLFPGMTNSKPSEETTSDPVLQFQKKITKLLKTQGMIEIGTVF